MPSQMGPFDMSCDAPPYAVVTACRRLSFQEPEDVRWCRLREILDAPSQEWDKLKRRPWNLLIRLGAPDVKACRCGRHLPKVDRYTFTFLTGRESSYLLGQCPRCRTIYWEDA
jgi:hypothetical protein